MNEHNENERLVSLTKALAELGVGAFKLGDFEVVFASHDAMVRHPLDDVKGLSDDFKTAFDRVSADTSELDF